MKKKLIITIILLSLVFGLIIASVLFLTKDDVKGYIITGDIGGFYCENLRCKAIKNDMFTNESEEKTTFNVYYKSTFLGNMIMRYNDIWNHYNLNHEWQSVPTDFTAFSPSLNANIISFTTRSTLTDVELDTLKDLLKKEDFDHELNNLNSTVYQMQLNDNQITDYVYVVNNNLLNHTDQYFFSIIYTIIDNEINILEYQSTTYQEELPGYQLFSAFNLKNNQRIGVIINKNYISLTNNPQMILYKLDKQELKSIVMLEKERTT